MIERNFSSIILPVRALFSIGFFALSFNSLLGQSIFQKHYTTNDGLPSNELYDIEEDSDGRLWFSSDNGVCYFDGKNFHSIATSPNIDNTIFELYKNQDKIWCLSMDGQLQYVKGIQYSEYSLNDTLDALSNLTRIIYGFKATKNEIYYGRFGSGLLKINQHDEITTLTPRFGRKGDPFFHFTQHEDEIIPSSQGKNLLKYPQIRTIGKFELSDTTFLFEFPEINNRIPQFKSVLIEKGKWLCSYNKWLFELSRNGVRLIKKFEHQIIALHIDPMQGIWIGFRNGGGLHHFPKGLINFEDGIRMLKKHSVSHIFTDSHQNLWVSTLNNGVYFSANPNSKLYFEQKVKTNNINDLLTIDENCFVLFENGDLSQITEDSVYHFPSPNPELKYHQIDQFPWGSLLLFGNESNPGYSFSLDSTQLFSPIWNNERGFCSISMGNTHYISIIGAGICQTSAKSVVPINQLFRGLRSDCMYQNSLDSIWIGNEQGIFLFEGKAIKNYAKTIDHFRVIDIDRIDQNTLLLAVKQKGNYLLDIKSGTISLFQSYSAYPIINNDVNDSIIWSCSSNKIYKTPLIPTLDSPHEVIIFDQYDGVIGTDIREIKVTKEFIYTFSEQGVNRLTIDNLIRKDYSPNLLINQLDIKNGYLNKGAFELTYGNNLFKITLESIDLSRKQQVDYYYKLEGLHDQFNALSGNQIELNSIPPGHYQLHLYASNGNSNSEVRTVNIIVYPPVWLTWWGILSISLIIIIITSLIVKRILIQKHKKHLELKNTEKEKVQLKLKALKAQMNPHFMFNSLNSIQYYILENDSDSAIVYLSKFSKLIRHILEESDVEYGALIREIEILKLYLELEQVRLENKFQYEIEIEDGIQLESIQIPSLLIQPIIENSVWHGISSKKELGLIKVHFGFNNNHLTCTVTDNGIGRKQASLHQSSHQFKKSMGMSISRERLNLLHSKVNDQINIHIEDLIPGDENSGTKVQIIIPHKTYKP